MRVSGRPRGSKPSSVKVVRREETVQPLQPLQIPEPRIRNDSPLPIRQILSQTLTDPTPTPTFYSLSYSILNEEKEVSLKPRLIGMFPEKDVRSISLYLRSQEGYTFHFQIQTEEDDVVSDVRHLNEEGGICLVQIDKKPTNADRTLPTARLLKLFASMVPLESEEETDRPDPTGVVRMVMINTQETF